MVTVVSSLFVEIWLLLTLSNMIVKPMPLAVTISKPQNSKLERLFCHVLVKRDVQALSFEL